MIFRDNARLLDVVLCLLLAALALALRLCGLEGLRLIDDEIFHVDMAVRPAGFIIKHSTESSMFPLWFFLFKPWLVLGDSDLMCRLFSIAWGCLTVVGGYCLGREVIGRRAGLITALLLAFNGFSINFSQTASPYAFLSFLGVSLSWSLLVLLKRGGWMTAVIHAALLSCAFYTHQSAGLLWGAEIAAVILLALGGRRANIRLLLASQALALCLSIGAFYILFSQWSSYRQFGIPFIPEVTPSVVSDLALQVVSYRSVLAWSRPFEVLAALAALLAGVYAAAQTGRGRCPERWPMSTLFCVAVLPFCACIFAGVFIAKDLLYAPRFFALFIPAGAALLAAEIHRLARGGRLRKVAAVLLVTAAFISQAGSLSFLHGPERRHERFPIDQVSEHLRRHSRRGDLALIHSSWFKPLFDRYYQAEVPRIVGAVNSGIQDKPFGGVLDTVTPRVVEETMALMRKHRRVFMVLTPTTNSQWRDPRGRLESAAERQFTLVHKICFHCEGADPVWIKLYNTREEEQGWR